MGRPGREQQSILLPFLPLSLFNWRAGQLAPSRGGAIADAGRPAGARRLLGGRAAGGAAQDVLLAALDHQELERTRGRLARAAELVGEPALGETVGVDVGDLERVIQEARVVVERAVL